MARILYPALQAPVLNTAQTTEQVTESRWHQPWSEPILGVRARQVAAVALIASGVSFSPFPLPNVVAQADFYNYAFSEPVRTKPGLNAALQQSFAVDPTALTVLETVTLSRWMLPLSEPVREKVGVRAPYHPPHTQVMLPTYRKTFCFGCIMVSGKRIG